MVVLFGLVASSSFGQVFPKKARHGKFEIFMSIEPLKGEGCMKTTARAGQPLSLSQCEDLLAQAGIMSSVDYRNPMMQVVKAPKVPKESTYHFIFGNGEKGWVLQKQ